VLSLAQKIEDDMDAGFIEKKLAYETEKVVAKEHRQIHAEEVKQAIKNGKG